MLACALDRNQQILLLAQALVLTENQENQEYFLYYLKKAYLSYTIDRVVFISNRDKGLVPATEKILLNITHTKYCYYIKENLVSLIDFLVFFLKKNY